MEAENVKQGQQVEPQKLAEEILLNSKEYGSWDHHWDPAVIVMRLRVDVRVQKYEWEVHQLQNYDLGDVVTLR